MRRHFSEFQACESVEAESVLSLSGSGVTSYLIYSSIRENESLSRFVLQKVPVNFQGRRYS